MMPVYGHFAYIRAFLEKHLEGISRVMRSKKDGFSCPWQRSLSRNRLAVASRRLERITSQSRGEDAREEETGDNGPVISEDYP